MLITHKNIIRSCIGCCRQLVFASHLADKQQTGINPLIKIGVSTMIVTLNFNLCAKDGQAVLMTLQSRLLKKKYGLEGKERNFRMTSSIADV